MVLFIIIVAIWGGIWLNIIKKYYGLWFYSIIYYMPVFDYASMCLALFSSLLLIHHFTYKTNNINM